MLKIVRRLGLGLSDVSSIPGMHVVDWRIVELKSSSTTIALCHKDRTLYVACYNGKTPPGPMLTEASAMTDPQAGMRIDSVDPMNIYPSSRGQFALYREKNPDTTHGDVHIKHTQILELVAAKGILAVQTVGPGLVMAHEANIYERLSLQTHPNLAEYLGVQVSDRLEFYHEGTKIQVPLVDKSVVGLVIKKYDCTLYELVIRRQKFDVRLCLKSISAAIQHLHKIGIVHGDLRPHNIFVKRGDKNALFVLGDFDSAHDTGSVITFKTGDNRWNRYKKAGIDHAQEDDDWSGFRKLTEWLVDKTGGKVQDYRGIGKTAVPRLRVS